jgi:hypothetical protein
MKKTLHNLRLISLIALGSSLLIGCVSNNGVRDLETIAKQEGERIYCSGYKSWADCYESVQKACTNHYEIISADENILSQGRSLRFKCK